MCKKGFSQLVVREDVGGGEGTAAFLARSQQVLSLLWWEGTPVHGKESSPLPSQTDFL